MAPETVLDYIRDLRKAYLLFRLNRGNVRMKRLHHPLARNAMQSTMGFRRPSTEAISEYGPALKNIVYIGLFGGDTRSQPEKTEKRK